MGKDGVEQSKQHPPSVTLKGGVEQTHIITQYRANALKAGTFFFSSFYECRNLINGCMRTETHLSNKAHRSVFVARILSYVIQKRRPVFPRLNVKINPL